MKQTSKPAEKWQALLVKSMIQFLELNKNVIGERPCSFAIQFYKGKKIEEIAESANLSTTRIRQLIDKVERGLDRYIKAANLAELNELKIISSAMEKENKNLKITLALNSLPAATPISKLNLSVRSNKILNTMNVSSVEQLCALEIEDIMKQKNAGMKTITELENALRTHGLYFGTN